MLTATGSRPESLYVNLRFYVAGAVGHEETWRGHYEMVDLEVADTVSRGAPVFLRARFDSIIGWVRREPFDMEQVRLMGDTTMLRAFKPAPTHQVSFSYGYESSVFMVWDENVRRFVVVITCC